MKCVAFVFVLTIAVALAAENPWKRQNGRFAAFQAPAAMVRNAKVGGDSYFDTYNSSEIELTFDSQVPVIPGRFQKDLERAVVTWVAQRKDNWAKHTYVRDGTEMSVAAIIGSSNNDISPGKPYYLYLGFGTFAIHIRFSSLDHLDEVERILKSIKITSK